MTSHFTLSLFTDNRKGLSGFHSRCMSLVFSVGLLFLSDTPCLHLFLFPFSPWCYPLGTRSSTTGIILYPTIPFSVTGQYRLKRPIPPSPPIPPQESAQALSQQCFYRLMLRCDLASPKNSRCSKDSGGASVLHGCGRRTKKSLLSMADFPGDFLRLTRS